MSLETQVQDALKVATRTQVTDTNIPVDCGHPGVPQPKHIWIKGTTDVEWGNEDSGFGAHDEDGVVEVIAYVVRMDSYVATRDILDGLVAYIKAGVAADRTLGGLVQSGLRITRIRTQEGSIGEVRGVSAIVTIGYAARVVG